MRHVSLYYKYRIPPKIAEIALLPGIWDGKPKLVLTDRLSRLSNQFQRYPTPHPILGPYSWQECGFCILGRIHQMNMIYLCMYVYIYIRTVFASCLTIFRSMAHSFSNFNYFSIERLQEKSKQLCSRNFCSFTTTCVHVCVYI